MLIGDVKYSLQGLFCDMGHLQDTFFFFPWQIREESNTKIDLPAENSNSETIVITGKKANCEAARHRILAIQKELVSETTGLLQMRDLKMLLEDISTEEVLVVRERREETNVGISLFLTLKPTFVGCSCVGSSQSQALLVRHFLNTAL